MYLWLYGLKMRVKFTIFIIKTLFFQILPLNNHVIFGFGAPATRQLIVTFLPSNTVVF